jgi:hypothetical protein
MVLAAIRSVARIVVLSFARKALEEKISAVEGASTSHVASMGGKLHAFWGLKT